VATVTVFRTVPCYEELVAELGPPDPVVSSEAGATPLRWRESPIYDALSKESFDPLADAAP
jgi:hypothetical protein